MKKLRIRWEGAQLVNHSLAYVNRELCLGLSALSDVELSILPTEPDTLNALSYPRLDRIVSNYHVSLTDVDFHIAHQWPPNFSRPMAGKWILCQPWEYGAVPRLWIPHILYEIDELWVYSEYNKQTYIQSGVPAEKLFVFPLGIDPALHTTTGDRHPLPTAKTWKFLFVGGTIWRKGIDILLRAYMNTFTRSDDVVLVIKDFGADSFYNGQTHRQMIEEMIKQPDAPEILYISDDLSESEMASLYRACDCLVHPYRGEGFGLPILEAMACGLPVIVPNDGPALDYTTPTTAFRIPSSRVKMEKKQIGDMDTIDFPQFIQVDESILCKTMRTLYENRDFARSVGIASSQHARQFFTWNASARRVYSHLQSIRTNKTMPEHIDWSTEAKAKLTSGDLQTSAWLWRKTLKEQPDHLEALFSLGTLCTLFRQYGEAITHLTRCLSQTDDRALLQNIHYYLGLSTYELLQYSAAVQHFTDALTFGETAIIRDALNNAEREMRLRRPKLEAHSVEDTEQLLRAVAHAFEGPTTVLRERRKQWVGLFKAGEIVLDIGCGDGIFMELLRDNGVASEGIDLDPVKIETARTKGLHVSCAYAEDYCQNKTATYDGVFLGHIVEHLSPQAVIELLGQATRALKPGGRIVILTPNIGNPIVQEHFWLDVTHIRPYPRLLIMEMLTALGLTIAEKGSLENDQEYYVVGKKTSVSLIWESPVFNTSGYATEGKTHLEALRTYPYAINLILRETAPLTDLFPAAFVQYAQGLLANEHKEPLVHIQFVPGHYFLTPKAPISIGRTMFETDRIPEDWVYTCNQLSEIWVPSQFNRDTFTSSGVNPEKIRVIPCPLDFDFYSPQPGKEEFRKANPQLRRFVFLSIFDWNYRKGWDILLQAFAEEFHPQEDVSLLLKISLFSNSDPMADIRKYLHSLGRDVHDVANIQVISSFLSDAQIRGLYVGSDAFVLPTRGEGWGRPYMEAMAMGIPVIGTKWSGNLEFMNDQNSYLIDIDGLETVDTQMEHTFYRGHHWAKPNVAATRKQMRYVFEQYRDAKIVAGSTRQDLKDKYSSSVIAEQMHRRIQELISQL